MRLRAAVQDLFGDEPAAPGSAAADARDDEAQSLLAAAEAQLGELRQAWAAALGRARQAERDWQNAQQAVTRLDAAVDEALRAGREPVARAHQRELNMWQGRLEALAGRRRAETDLAEHLALAARGLDQKLAAARGRLDELAARNQMAAAHEQLGALRQTLAQLAAGLPEGKDRAP